jgi:hypothetical protein
MPSSDPTTIPPRPPTPRRWAGPIVLFDAFATGLDRLSGRLASRIGDAAWEVLHVVGTHRWREGWETNLERGWRQYRGARCTICDVPWEGW